MSVDAPPSGDELGWGRGGLRLGAPPKGGRQVLLRGRTAGPLQAFTTRWWPQPRRDDKGNTACQVALVLVQEEEELNKAWGSGGVVASAAQQAQQAAQRAQQALEAAAAAKAKAERKAARIAAREAKKAEKQAAKKARAAAGEDAEEDESDEGSSDEDDDDSSSSDEEEAAAGEEGAWFLGLVLRSLASLAVHRARGGGC